MDTDIVDAVPVLFDPSLDVAVLYAPRLAGRTLRFATAIPERGSQGAALGKDAGGGALVVLPAAVAASYRATGHDIYDRTQVQRDIIELRAAIEPGDSGGPLILEERHDRRPRVRGSRADPNVGYALSPIAVSSRVAPAIGRTGAADVGPCID